MDLLALESLIKNGESDTLEFKKSTAQLKAAVETLCAFLNHQGGTVLIGVDGQGRMIGQDVTDSTQQEIANELKKMEPPAQIQVNYLLLSNKKQIIILQVSLGVHAPYIYDGRAFQRKLTSTQRMPQQRYDQLISQRHQLNYSWESFPARGYTFQDLDENLILGVVRKAVEKERLPEIALRQSLSEVLEKLELSQEGQIHNAAVALFGKRFNADFIQCELKVARFKGVDRHEFLDSNLIRNNFFELLEAGLLFARRHLPLAAHIESGQVERVETPLIPFNAIREALINALCHRNYSDRGGSVGLAIYDDRMEIFNDGGLLQEVTLEKIKAGYSKPRNPIMANVLYRCNVIERWGRGIREIIQSCLKAGDPEPQFKVDGIEFKVIFPFPTSLKLETFKATYPLEQLTLRQREIIQILQDENQGLKATQIREKMLEPPAERTLRENLTELKQLGIIESRGQARATVWFFVRLSP
jgi:ATP-dependent DNA helicase RecG